MGSLRQEPDVLLRTPDLGSDFSDSTSTTFSSGPSTPPSLSPPRHEDLEPHKNPEDSVPSISSTTTPTAKPTRPNGIVIPTTISPTVKCSKCILPLLTTQNGGKFVTVPEEEGAPPKMYHQHCFRCSVCNAAFDDNRAGQAVFVRTKVGICHVDCAPKERAPRQSKIPTYSSSMTGSSSRYDRPPTTAPPVATAFPKFGGGTACPGCRQSVSPMERGVVPGPAGSRWHSSCLVCGGKDTRGRAGRRNKGEPGCGKKLDSAARWHSSCLVCGGKNKPVDPQHTGTTTIARQFTGMGGGDSLLRQMTGGSISPTRQLSSSPTKQLGMGGGTRHARPKSVIGMRGEGRGMRLVQQMTGGRGGDYLL